MSDPSRNVSAEIALDGQNQYLRRWLDARSQQQVTVGHPLKDVRLPIQLKSMPESKLEVTNLTEAELPIIVLRGPDDLYYFVSPLPAGQTTELQPQGLVDVEPTLQAVAGLDACSPTGDRFNFITHVRHHSVLVRILWAYFYRTSRETSGLTIHHEPSESVWLSDHQQAVFQY